MSTQIKTGFLTQCFSALLVLFLISDCSYAQLGYSSASMAMGRQRSENYIVPHPNEIVLEEYYNYHKHDLPEPSKGESVNLDLRWGNPRLGEVGLLQVGLSTTSGNTDDEAAPVNIGLVIDRSGSMNGQKLQKTKEALLTMVNHLQPEDQISIIAFDHQADVLLPATYVGNKTKVRQVIRNLQTRGSTDLNRGIITGYNELVKAYSAKQSNRLIILTDAMTNTGELDPSRIVANSSEYDAALNIDFVFIGVGMNVNYELARKLTESKQNTFHFIDNAADITKVFDAEVASLLHPVAKNAELEIEFDQSVTINDTYDFASVSRKSNYMKFQLNNMNQGLTQVVLTAFRMTERRAKPVKVTLTYDNVKTGNRETIVRTLNMNRSSNRNNTLITDHDVLKNETIASMAGHLKSMAEAIHIQKDKKLAAQEISDGLYLAEQRFPGLEDVDVKRVYDILEKYQTDLEHYTER